MHDKNLESPQVARRLREAMRARRDRFVALVQALGASAAKAITRNPPTRTQARERERGLRRGDHQRDLANKAHHAKLKGAGR